MNTLTEYTSFLDLFFESINQAHLDISGLDLDHIAYQTSSKNDYELILPQMSKMGQLVSAEKKHV